MYYNLKHALCDNIGVCKGVVIFLPTQKVQKPKKSKKISTLHDVQDAYLWRRKRDLNPRDTFAPYSLSRGAPSPLGYFSSLWRRGWDSNPRALSDKRFSRPPRYDHFDTSPYLRLTSKYILTNR